MTPITDHQTEKRKEAIRTLGLTPRQHVQLLLSEGFEYRAACKIAGLDEHAEVKQALTLWFVLAVLVTLAAFLIYFAMPKAQAQETKVRAEAVPGSTLVVIYEHLKNKHTGYIRTTATDPDTCKAVKRQVKSMTHRTWKFCV